MISVKGLFHNGVARPAQPIAGHDGQPVIITFLEEAEETPNKQDDSARKIGGVKSAVLGPEEIRSQEDTLEWEMLTHLIEECAVETGLTDLAQQHDYYLYNKPKRE